MSENTSFIGLEHLIGKQLLEKRRQAKVIVVGVGGIGSWATECLIRSSVGHITLIDLDDICISNTNRQIHTLNSTLGQSKVKILKARLQDISPESHITGIEDFLTNQNMEQYITPGTFVLDAIDSLKVKCELIDFCLEKNIPLVTTGGAAGKADPSQVRTADLSQTFNDPLLLRVRKKLRRAHDFPKKKKVHLGVKTVFSPEEMTVNTMSPNIVCDAEAVIPNCSNGLGTCVTVISIFGIYAAKEILKTIDTSL